MQTTLGSALHYSQQNKYIIANLIIIIKPYAIQRREAKNRCSLDSRREIENKLPFPTTHRRHLYYIRYRVVIYRL